MLTAGARARLEEAWRAGLPGAWRAALAPATLAYRGGLAIREAAYRWGLFRTRALPCRVVAVGNLAVGGTGKTPVVDLVARRLLAEGRRVTVLSRGYGRRAERAVRLVADGDRVLLGAAEAGDEPVLLARLLPGVPVVVGRDRYEAGAWALRRLAPDVLLLDDGFQHRRLRKDVEIVCLDARAPWGGGLLPAGRLREPPAALGRASLIVLTHADAVADRDAVTRAVRRFAPAAPIAWGVHEAEGLVDTESGALSPVEALRGRRVLGFAGIASPEDFRATLLAHGADLRGFAAFPDHHAYVAETLGRLAARAREAGAEALVTTEKDAVRLPGRQALPVWALRIRVRLRAPDEEWWRALRTSLSAGGARA